MKFVKMGSYKNSENQTISVHPFWISNEISNREYREFVDDIQKHPKDTLQYFNYKELVSVPYPNLLEFISVDTLALSKLYTPGSEKYKLYQNYYTNKDFDKFPVVGVSFEGAHFYCIWKTKQELRNLKDTGLTIQDYRLPTKEEWMYVFSLVKNDKKSISNNIDCCKCNKHKSVKISNLFGNVSEWSTQKGNSDNERIIIGNSFYNNQIMPDGKSADISKSFGDTGFRMVRTFLGKQQLDNDNE